VSQAETISIAEKLERAQERIQAACQRAGRAAEVTLVAVTKAVSVDRIAEAYRCGARHFGENRVQEFEEKRRGLTLPSAVWHVVGHVQTNKAKKAVELFDRIDSVDSLRLSEKLAAEALQKGKKLPVLVEVRLGAEATKSGVAPEQLAELAAQLAGLKELAVRGLMAVPPYLEPAERVRPYFRRLRELAEAVASKGITGIEMKTLSMGMSHDFEVAIEEGATEVRLGTAIFGPRPGD